MDIDQFASKHVTTEIDTPFRLENSYTIDIAVDGSVLAKAGSMVAYTGDLSSTGKSSAECGIGGFLKQAATGEGSPVMSIEGEGNVYLADSEKKVQLPHSD
ncbi:MAG: AIM24 family protein [Halodesulfurarchaeum sp.]|nr:AIM24 family protein [Halodesulfurarchaeum sp.]